MSQRAVFCLMQRPSHCQLEEVQPQVVSGNLEATFHYIVVSHASLHASSWPCALQWHFQTIPGWTSMPVVFLSYSLRVVILRFPNICAFLHSLYRLIPPPLWRCRFLMLQKIVTFKHFLGSQRMCRGCLGRSWRTFPVDHHWEHIGNCRRIWDHLCQMVFPHNVPFECNQSNAVMSWNESACFALYQSTVFPVNRFRPLLMKTSAQKGWW